MLDPTERVQYRSGRHERRSTPTKMFRFGALGTFKIKRRERPPTSTSTFASYIQHSRHASLQGDNDHVDEAEDEEDADIDDDDDEVNYTMTPQR